MRRGALAGACVAGCVAGCHAVPPPPMLLLHEGTVADARGETSAMVVVGVAGQLLGGGGLGVALRVQHQATDQTALGVELSGGAGGEDHDLAGREPPRRWLFGVRGFGRTTPRAHDWTAVTYGAGLSVLSTGLVTASVHVGDAASYPNDYAVPLLQLSTALALPLRHGAGFGSPLTVPSTRWWWAAEAGVVEPVGHTGNAPSLEVGVAAPVTGEDDEGLLSLSIGDRQR